MKRVPAEEFAEHAAKYLEGTETVAIERDGEVIGRYVPAPNGHAVTGSGARQPALFGALSEEERRKRKAEARAAFVRLRQTLQQIYDETGLTEDEFADLLDPGKPFPYDDPGKSQL